MFLWIIRLGKNLTKYEVNSTTSQENKCSLGPYNCQLFRIAIEDNSEPPLVVKCTKHSGLDWYFTFNFLKN